ncbi:hypothetical protein PINS_up014098 [Pythium insidiosum]|nr:hypothetical protein PINS_up014098 [Pythium insidiosum]
MHAVALQESLRLENDRLVARIERHLKFQDTVRHANATMLPPCSATAETPTFACSSTSRDDENNGNDSTTATTTNNNNNNTSSSSWIFFKGDDEPFFFASYSPSDCDTLLSGMSREAMALDDAFRRQQYPTGARSVRGAQRKPGPDNGSIFRDIQQHDIPCHSVTWYHIPL